jgi:hypothetical protein
MKNEPKKINIDNLSIRILSGVFGYLFKAPAEKISSNQFNKELIGVDPETKQEFPLKLLTFKRIDTGVIPEIFMYHSEGANTPNHVIDVVKRSKVSSINDLAYYVYERINSDG